VPSRHRGVFVRVDILQRRRDQRWRLIEVKSTTDVRDHHLNDVAIQHRVVTRSGLDLAASCLAHVSREYVYEGGPIDVHRFFEIKNLTRQVERLQPEITVQLRSEFRVLAMPEAPQIPAGRQCSDPFICEFLDYCNPSVPDDHILQLPRIHVSTVANHDTKNDTDSGSSCFSLFSCVEQTFHAPSHFSRIVMKFWSGETMLTSLVWL
jgi:hypothetical protein